MLELHAKGLQGVLRSGGNPRQLPPLPPLPVVMDPVRMAQLTTARQQVQQLRSQLDQLATRLDSRRETLRLQQRLAADLRPLYENGGVARNQYLTQLNQVQETRAEVVTLEEERNRVIGQAASQLNEINRQTISLRSELVGLKETISYRTIKAPIAGRVFDTKISRYSVINADQTALKLVPANRLQAVVQISNADIGFVRTGMPVNVSVDSFPSGEFGYIEGTLTSIGSDALPPNPQASSSNATYTFPATVSLKQQRVEAGREALNLQSGMSVSANVKLRSRPVITVVTDMFTKQLDGVKRFR
jgi:HlyD family secretion protein